MVAIPDVARELTASDHFLVTIHVNPDGDAIGSLLGMVRLLTSLGKHAVAVSHDPVPERYRFLPNSEMIRTVDEAEALGPFDAVVFLDAGERNRIGDVSRLVTPGMKVVNIDHHISNSGFGDAAWVDTEASAVCEMLVELYRHMGVEIDSEVAEMLYTGIMTDTGRFRFSNSTAKAFATAAKLVARGANPAEISTNVFYKTSERIVKTLGNVLSRVELSDHGRIAISYLSDDEAGVDTEGFVDSIVSIDSVEVAVLLRPIGEKLYKGSFRSSGEANVSDIAEGFNGGGHAKAAGGKIEGDLTDVKRKVVAACQKALANITDASR